MLAIASEKHTHTHKDTCNIQLNVAAWPVTRQRWPLDSKKHTGESWYTWYNTQTQTRAYTLTDASLTPKHTTTRYRLFCWKFPSPTWAWNWVGIPTNRQKRVTHTHTHTTKNEQVLVSALKITARALPVGGRSSKKGRDGIVTVRVVLSPRVWSPHSLSFPCCSCHFVPIFESHRQPVFGKDTQNPREQSFYGNWLKNTNDRLNLFLFIIFNMILTLQKHLIAVDLIII